MIEYLMLLMIVKYRGIFGAPDSGDVSDEERALRQGAGFHFDDIMESEPPRQRPDLRLVK